MTTFPKGTAVDTNNLQLGERIHVDLSFCNVTYICGFISIITFVCENTISLWVFLTVSKRFPVHIIRFILTTLNY